MKINVSKGVGVKTNAESSKKIKMRINADMGMALVTRYLYSNPIQTLTQEYLCNGRDAIRMAGKTDPVEVTLPTLIDPTLKIRDFGNGISEDAMDNVFCVLGESEKRNTDEQTGGFGIGAKSGWAYTDSFMIRTIVDGVSSLYLAHMGEAQSGTLERLSQNKTKEPSGVEIQINVKDEDIMAFHTAVYRATQFWDVKPVIKGALPEEIPSFWKTSDPLLQGQSWTIYKTESLPGSIVDKSSNAANIIFAVDKIAYRLSNAFNEFEIVKSIKINNGAVMRGGLRDHAPLLRADATLIVFVNNNDVEVAANREELNNNEYTKKQVTKILTEVVASIASFRKDRESEVDSVAKLLDLQKHEKRAFSTVSAKTFTKDEVTYSLESSQRLSITSPKLTLPLIFDKYTMSKNRTQKITLSCIEARVIDYHSADVKLLFKDNQDGSGLTREKVRTLFDTKTTKWDNQSVYVLDYHIPSEQEVIKSILKELSFEYLSAIKMPEKVRVASTRPSSKGKVVVHHLTANPNSYRNAFEEKTTYLDQSELESDNWLYIALNKDGHKTYPLMRKKLSSDHWSIANSTFSSMVPFFEKRGWKICTVSEKQFEKVKDLANFKSFDEFIFNAEKNIPLTQAEKTHIQSSAWRSIPHWISSFKGDLSAIKDKDVHELVRLEKKYHAPSAKSDIPHFVRNTLLVDVVNKLISEVNACGELIRNVDQRYPLATANLTFKNDTLIYVNAKYKELNKKKD